MIIDRRKSVTKWSIYGKCSFHFSPTLACTLRTRNLFNFVRRRTTVDGTAWRTDLILVTHTLTQAVTNWRSTILSRDTRPWILGSQSTDRRALRAEYCIVGIPHNTAIQVEIYLFGVLVYTQTTLHWCIPLTTFHKRIVHLTETHLPFHHHCGRLWNRANHYVFVLWFLLSSSSFLSPILSGRKLDAYHTSTHDVALVRI